jgi:hypothetical protein
MILWTHEQHGEVSLPSFLSHYRQYRPFPREGVRAVVRAQRNGGETARADMEFLSPSGELVARIEGYECVMSASLRDAFRNSGAGER